MATKIMLVLDNREDQDFLEKVLIRLKYTVISMNKGVDLSEQLIDHFPDVVFASTLGRNARILNALGKIKEARGKPKLVFVKMKNEKTSLTTVQKQIIDGTLYTPIDPFKLIDVLANTTELDKIDLRRRYNEMLESDRGGRSARSVGSDEGFDEDGDEGRRSEAGKAAPPDGNAKPSDFGSTQVIGKLSRKGIDPVDPESAEFYGTYSGDEFPDKSGTVAVDDEQGENLSVAEAKAEGESSLSSPVPGVATTDEMASPISKNPTTDSILIHDPERKKKYAQIAENLKAQPEQPTPIDIQELRRQQSAQAKEVSEKPGIKVNRKHFLKTLFTMDPKKASGKD